MGYNPPKNLKKNHEKVTYNSNFSYVYDTFQLLSIHEGF